MNRETAFFTAVRRLFGGKLTQDQVDGINSLILAWDKHGDGDDRKLAYVLGTAKHETANTMQPITERGARSYFDKYEAGTRIGKTLGNTIAGDGYRFRGRGHVQLTGRANYVKAGKKLGIDLAAKPDMALDPAVSARVCIVGMMEGWFTGKELGDYFNDHANWVDARRIVNGTDRAALIAGYAMDFHSALLAGRSAPAAPTTPGNPAPPASERPSLLAAILNFILAIFGRKPK